MMHGQKNIKLHYTTFAQPRYMKTKMRFITVGEIKSPRKRCIRVEMYQAARTAEEIQTLREFAAFFKSAKKKKVNFPCPCHEGTHGSTDILILGTKEICVF